MVLQHLFEPLRQLKIQFKCGPHSTMDSILVLHPVAPGPIPGAPEVFSDKFFREGKNCCDEKGSMLLRLIGSAAA